MAAEPETDFSTMSDVEALAVAKRARRDAAAAPEPHLARLGKACARLHDLGWTWDRIGREMGVNLSTAYRWARPYLCED